MKTLSAMLLAAAVALTTSCTIIRTETATVYDFHPTGDALDITLQKPDGTILRATRNQESSADIVDTVANAVRPSMLY